MTRVPPYQTLLPHTFGAVGGALADGGTPLELGQQLRPSKNKKFFSALSSWTPPLEYNALTDS